MLSIEFCDACVLFGDSITQTAAPGTLCSRMGEYYERRLDVVNRGFSGYNTRLCLPTLLRVLGGGGMQGQRIRLFTIWLGANDSVHHPGLQHVPLPEYREALVKLVRLVQNADNRTRIILITPPPFLTDFWRTQHIAWAITEGRAKTPEEALNGTNRDTITTKAYGRAVIETAHQTGVEVVDLLSGMPMAAGGDSEALLRPYFTDGLHLSSDGYKVVFDMVRSVIENNFPELDPRVMLAGMPDYSEFDEADAAFIIDKAQRRYREVWP